MLYTYIILHLPTVISRSNTVYSILKQCMKPRPNIELSYMCAFRQFCKQTTVEAQGDDGFLISTLSFITRHQYCGTYIWYKLIQMHWNCAVRHPEKYKRAFFQSPFTPEALITARTFILTFALLLIAILTWHFSVMLTELLCVKREDCGLSWSHGCLCVFSS